VECVVRGATLYLKYVRVRRAGALLSFDEACLLTRPKEQAIYLCPMAREQGRKTISRSRRERPSDARGSSGERRRVHGARRGARLAAAVDEDAHGATRVQMAPGTCVPCDASGLGYR